MLEEKVTELIEAMRDLTAALKGGKPPAATSSTAAAPAKAVTKLPVSIKLDFTVVKAAVIRVKDAKGKPAAQRIIKDVGQATELAAIKPAQFAAVMAACEALLNDDINADEPLPAEDEL